MSNKKESKLQILGKKHSKLKHHKIAKDWNIGGIWILQSLFAKFQRAKDKKEHKVGNLLLKGSNLQHVYLQKKERSQYCVKPINASKHKNRLVW